MDIVDSFDDDYDYANGDIPYNAVIAVEADAPAVPQSRTFSASDFLGWDVAFLLSSSFLSSSSKLWYSNNNSLSSRLSHRYGTE